MESKPKPVPPHPLSLLLAEIEALGYCAESNVHFIRTDISLPPNFPFECPIERGAIADPTFYLKDKAQWISEALGKKVAFTFPATPQNIVSAKMGLPVTVTDPDPKLDAYIKNGQIIIVLPLYEWLRQGGTDWYLHGAFIDPAPEDQAIKVELKPAPSEEELKTWEGFDLFRRPEKSEF